MSPDLVLKKAAAPIIVAGMHRSGTSLTASLLHAASLDVGDRLVSTDSNNPNGYFEDVDFVELQQKILMRCCSAGVAGHQDWGWTEDERLNFDCIKEFFPEARALLGNREIKARQWGWKDPRTTLLLDFWDELLEGHAFYLLVYRFPWDVADSMQRIGAEIFLRNPEYAYRIWSYYNRHLCDFYARHADRCLLVSVNALRGQLQQFTSLLSEKFGLVGSEVCLEEIFDNNLFSTVQGEDPLISLAAQVWPDCIRLLDELDRMADISSAGLWHASSLGGHVARLRVEEDAPPVNVSVIVPCYNQGALLIEAIASVERFAPAGSELIIVNDGSTDERTLEILDILKRSGYYVIDQRNMGLSAARNAGIAQARGTYILPLDDDNRIRSGFIQQAVQVLDSCPEVGVVYGDRNDFGLRNGVQRIPEFNPDMMLKDNYIDACAIFRKQVWEDCNGYDVDMPVLEDWEFWIHAAECGWKFHHLNSVAFDYRVRPGSLISRAACTDIREAVLKRIWSRHPAVYSSHLAKWEARLKAVEENTNAQIAYRDQLVADWEARLKAVNENANAQIAYRDQLIAKLETEFRIWVPVVSKLQRVKHVLLSWLNK